MRLLGFLIILVILGLAVYSFVVFFSLAEKVLDRHPQPDAIIAREHQRDSLCVVAVCRFLRDEYDCEHAAELLRATRDGRLYLTSPDSSGTLVPAP